MNIKYRCLVLDHDDTAVKSTPDIHYPSFVEVLKVIRPDSTPLSLEEYIQYNFKPGFVELCRDILKMTDDEQEFQYRHWREYVKGRIPEFYSGVVELIRDFKNSGGIITVVSHSQCDQIQEHYRIKCDGIIPDMIFGWDMDEKKRKPSPYPVLEIMKNFDLKESEVLVVDDLFPGLQMARSSKVAFAGVGWSHKIKEIEDFMKLNADYYLPTVESLRNIVFE